MTQEELLLEIKILGNDILRDKIFDSTNSTYMVDKDIVIEWFEKIKRFIFTETDSDLKIKLKTFITENQQYLSPTIFLIDENGFERIRCKFRECFTNTSCFLEN